MFLFSSCNSFLTLMRMRSWDTIEASLSQWRVCLYPGIPDSLESILFAQIHQCFYCVRHQQPTLHLFTALTALNRSSLRWGGPLESCQHLSRMRSLHAKTLPDVCQERKVVIRNHQECSIKPIIVTDEQQLGKQSRGVERTQNLESKIRDLKPAPLVLPVIYLTFVEHSLSTLHASSHLTFTITHEMDSVVSLPWFSRLGNWEKMRCTENKSVAFSSSNNSSFFKLL